MADKRINPLLFVGMALAMGCLSLVMCSDGQDRYQPVTQIPGFDSPTQAQDGDTQTDTIKALQAYAREAVKKADDLNASTQDKMGQVLQNQQKVSQLERANQQAQTALDETKTTVNTLEQRLRDLKRELVALKKGQGQAKPLQDPAAVGQLNSEGLPTGFGFGGNPLKSINPDQGSWYNPIDYTESATDAQGNQRFTGLLPRTPNSSSAKVKKQASQKPETVIEPIYTLPKDATLTDSLALTALIGRIPVDGQTPDPYPVKIYIGKENLLANGHDIPEVEGMIFSGLGLGDWNLSCVSARLTSATFIFSDGAIVNHRSEGKPLGYISDPSGVPCVSGRFVTNAPAFISQRIGLAGLGAAGAAYAEAQQQRQTSSLTGSTTSTVVGDINKVAAGEAVQSATDEVSRWLLARQKQSFDAVVVSPGAAVSVHLDRSLALDKSSLARRVRYAKEITRAHVGLD